MKKLILFRHGKSSWNELTSDKERKLEASGEVDAEMVSKKLIDFLPTDYQIFSSTAKRASQTATIVSKTINYPLEKIIFENDLYTFDEDELEQAIKFFDESYHCVIIFGHNNALTDFVNKFSHQNIDNVPTAGVVILDFECDSWKKITKTQNIKTLFPKDLK